MTSNTNQAPQLPQVAVKSRFFAQYWGVKCFQNIMNDKYGYETYPEPFMDESNMNGQFCKLKPLSILSDEDYRKIAKLYVKPIFRNKENYIDEVAQFKIFMIEEIDFLRSKGYAVPFMEYSVDDLISFGWVQLL
jgi:hypothetical protein